MNIKLPSTGPILLGIIVIAALIVPIRHCQKVKDIHTAITNIQYMKKIIADSTTYWRDKFDVEHAEKYMLEGDLVEMKAVYGDMITKKAQELKVKDKQIASIINFNSRQQLSMDSLIKQYAQYDTTYSHGVGGDTIRIIQRFPEYINIKDTFGVTQYTKNEGFLKLRKAPYIDIVSYTSSTVVSGIQGYRLKSIEPAFKIVPSASVVYFDNKFIPSIGVGVQIKVMKLPVVISIQKGFQ